jgi:DNA polymerase-3 subunit epsilon
MAAMASRFLNACRHFAQRWALPASLPDRWVTPPPGPLLAQPYVVFDLETTGLAPRRGDQPVQIGAVRIEDGQEFAQFATLVHPGRPIPALSTRFHGVTDAMVTDAPDIATAFTEFARFAEGAVLVAHNAAFDRTVLGMTERAGAPALSQPLLCSMLLARWLDPREADASLDGLCGRMGLVIEGRHQALGDARATAVLWLHLLARASARGIAELPELVQATRMRLALEERAEAF